MFFQLFLKGTAFISLSDNWYMNVTRDLMFPEIWQPLRPLHIFGQTNTKITK